MSNQEIEVSGIITRSFSARGSFISSLNTGEGTYEIISDSVIIVGSAVKVKGTTSEYNGRVQIRAANVYSFSESESKAIRTEIEKKAEARVMLTDSELLVSGPVMDSIKPLLQSAAKRILTAKSLNRFILLRFHGDADGISGAFALTKMCKMQPFQQNAAIYSVNDAMRDLQLLHHEFMPLFIMLDFGSNAESDEGLKLLKAGGVEILTIDHHPPGAGIQKIADLFISPWAVVSPSPFRPNEQQRVPAIDVSKYPAGYLAVEIARLAGIKGIEPLAKISCAGDKSTVLPVEKQDKDKALVLDFMASYSGFGNNLDFYASVMDKPELFYSMLNQANEKTEQIFESAKRLLKEKDIKGVKVSVVDLEKLVKKHEFPSRGKIVTKIFEMLMAANPEQPIVVLGHGDKSVIIRMNEPAVSRGLAGDKIIIELRSKMGDFIENGGGHAKAAAMKVREDFAKDVIEELIKVIDKTLA
jgi:RecJ-like exonuclease